MFTILKKLRGRGLRGAAAAFQSRLGIYRVRSYEKYCTALRGGAALEVGGPSPCFRNDGFLPIYRELATLDGCNFGIQTIWEGQLAEGPHFRYAEGRECGWQFICEGSELSAIASARYDAVISSHAIEHFANPLKALTEWMRVIKTGGHILLVVPHRDGTFDRRRALTPFAHLVEDWKNDVGENDPTHLEEWMGKFDPGADAGADEMEAFRERSLKFAENRAIHHHVFNVELVLRVMDFVGLQICEAAVALPFHIVAIGRKVAADGADNGKFSSAAATYRRTSPFRSDRR